MPVDPSAETDRILKKQEKKIFSEVEIRYMIESEITKKTETKQALWAKVSLALLPFIVAAFIWASSIEKRWAIMEQNQNTFLELRKEIREINIRLHNIEIILASEGIGRQK